MPADSPAPPPQRPPPGVFLFDATSVEGRQAAAALFRRLAVTPPRAGRAARRAGIAALCGEAFCRRLEALAPNLPWERA